MSKVFNEPVELLRLAVEVAEAALAQAEAELVDEENRALDDYIQTGSASYRQGVWDRVNRSWRTGQIRKGYPFDYALPTPAQVKVRAAADALEVVEDNLRRERSV